MIQNNSLVENIFDTASLVKKSTRDGFGSGVVELGRNNAQIVVLSADLKESTRAEVFEKEFKDRYIELGVAEQNMATVASGLAAVGKIPFITSYAAFSPGRNYEQIRTTIALNNQNVKVCGMHAGLSVGPDGATHQMLEDIAMMRALPNMIVVSPVDAVQAHKAVVAAGLTKKPVYLRFGRSDVPVFTSEQTPFEIGKAYVLWKSAQSEVVLYATGSLAYQALLAARSLESDGVGSTVVMVPTITPLDEQTILETARANRRAITIEEHQITGGLGSAVCELLSEKHPLRVKRLGVANQFGQSGTPDELFEHYGLSVSHIVTACKEK
jgi:transketolase